jgi:hypothetical protein
MPRAKASFTSVELTRAIKAARSAGLAITMTRIDPDGSIILSHGDLGIVPREATPDDALSKWQAKRKQA